MENLLPYVAQKKVERLSAPRKGMSRSHLAGIQWIGSEGG